jgi:GNAT superfamily N-acetyltransferase
MYRSQVLLSLQLRRGILRGEECPMHQVEILDARELSEAAARAIAELIVKVWPKLDKPVEFRKQQLLQTGLGYIGPDSQAPRSMLISDSGRVIAHASLIPRKIGTTAGDMTIAGLARVCSDPDYRGQGLGELVVKEVFRFVDDKTFSFSLFQTNQKIQPFYEKLGAEVVLNRILNSLTPKLHDSPFWDELVMRYPKEREWPEGDIDLRGPGY